MKKTIFTTVLALFSILLFAQQSYLPTKENLEARAEFEKARFGMFIHWGISSFLCDGEWVMETRHIPVSEYNKLIDFFDPEEFDAADWVKIAKQAGMKYITFVSRHHDSFSNWDTQQSDWKITKTRYGKDVLKILADECRKQDIKLCLYYSTADWYRSDYQWETGRTGQHSGRTGKSDWKSYIHFMKAQLTELLSNYGPITAIWFDGHWDQTTHENRTDPVANVDWHYDEIYGLIHQLQPQCLIANNHHLPTISGEDFQIFEKDLPGENMAGFSGQAVSNLMPLETCATVGHSWGYHIKDNHYQSTKELIHLLVRAAGYGGNLLLNTGPMPNGKIQPEHIERFAQMGEWMNRYGNTIYETQGGFVPPQTWGAITQKGKLYYIHVLKKENDSLTLSFPAKIQSARWLNADVPLIWKQNKKNNETTFSLNVPLDDTDAIIEVVVK